MTQPSDSSRQHDVRMRGFHSRTPVEDALAWIDANVDSLDSETVALAEAHGRVLASEIISPINVPAFDRSAMDGFALKSAETVGAGDYNPLSFRIVGASLPGQPFEGTVGSGEAARIMTGAPIPAGVDAVVPAEYATVRENSVEITTAVASLKHIGRTAEDVAAGTTVLDAGHRLRPQDVGLIASLGQADVPVIRQPRIRIVVTGNELAEPGSERSPYQIFEANSHIVAGLVPRDGGVLFEKVRCQDDRDSILKAVTDAVTDADVVLISGGSSVGSEDHAPNIVRETGELPIHGIAMRPSSPAGIGRIESTLIFLLPGNPVSCLCAYDFFAGRAIRRLAGLSPEWPHRTFQGTLSSKIVSQVGRVDYCRVRINEDKIEPVALSGASILSSTTRANGFVIVPSALEGYAAGTEVEVRLYS